VVEGGWRALFAGVGICAGCLAWGMIAAAGLGALFRRPGMVRALDRLTGGVLIAFGVKLVLDARRI